MVSCRVSQLIQALYSQQLGACTLPCIEVAMFEFSLSLSFSVVAMRVSAGREQLGHDSQSAQHPSSSGEFN